MAEESGLGSTRYMDHPSQMSPPNLNNSNDDSRISPPSTPLGIVLVGSPPSIPGSETSEPPSPTTGSIRNFGEISPGVYRSGFPGSGNIEHLQSLNLKTLITLVVTPFEPELEQWIASSGVEHYRINIVPHKRHDDKIPIEDIASVMKLLTDDTKQPLLMHCNKGRHRTGCMTAAYCKLRGIGEEKVLAEYQEYAHPKLRDLDMMFIKGLKNEDVRDAMARLEGPIPRHNQHGQHDGSPAVIRVTDLAKDFLTRVDGSSGRSGNGSMWLEDSQPVGIRRVILGPEMPLSPPQSFACKGCSFSVQELVKALSRIRSSQTGRDVPTPPATPSPSE